MHLRSSISRSISKSIFRSVHRATSVPAALMGGVSVPASAFDDVWGWWRADSVGGSSPSMTFNDLSGNSRTMTQQAGTLTLGTAANGQAKVTGGATAYVTTSGALKNWPITVVTYGQRTAATTQGHFGHVGATGFDTLWTGYESSDRHMIYNTNSTINVNAATDGCWVTRIGWGSRVAIINGLSQLDVTHANRAQSADVACSIGTQYRGLNFAWQETLVWDRLLSIAELDEVYSYLNTRYGASIPLSTARTPAKTITLCGESNPAGRGDRGVANANIPNEYLGPITNANVLHGLTANINWGFANTQFEQLDNTAAKNGFTGNHMLGENPYSNATSFIGCESALCKEYLDLHGGSVYLVKYAVGSSYLAQQGAVWWGHDAGMASSGRQFHNAMGAWWRSMSLHHSAGREPDHLGCIWIQGANDASNLTHANNYQANLAAFLPALRKEMGYPDLKLLVARLHATCPEAYSSTVRAAQEAVIPTLDNVQQIDMDGYETRAGDTVHYSINGQIALGQYLATQL